MKKTYGLLIAGLLLASTAAADTVTVTLPGWVSANGLGSGVGADIRVDQFGFAEYDGWTRSIAGSWDLADTETKAFQLPTGATVKSESITFGPVHANVWGYGDLPVIDSATLNTVSVFQVCGTDAYNTNTFTGNFTGSYKFSLSPCQDQSYLNFDAEFGGQASLAINTDIFNSSFPTTPGFYTYSAYLDEAVDFSYTVDYSVPGAALPEPIEAGPIVLIAGAFLLRGKWRSRARKV